MSIIKSIKAQLGLGPAAENHHWDGSVANQLSLKRGTPEAPGAELIKALNGVLSFPNQGQSLGGNGYIKLPGGLIVQWGSMINDNSQGGGLSLITFPVAFPTAALRVMVEATVASPAFVLGSARVQTDGLTTTTAVVAWYDAANALTTGGVYGAWIAIGY